MSLQKKDLFPLQAVVELIDSVKQVSFKSSVIHCEGDRLLGVLCSASLEASPLSLIQPKTLFNWAQPQSLLTALFLSRQPWKKETCCQLTDTTSSLRKKKCGWFVKRRTERERQDQQWNQILCMWNNVDWSWRSFVKNGSKKKTNNTSVMLPAHVVWQYRCCGSFLSRKWFKRRKRRVTSTVRWINHAQVNR